MNVKNFSNAWKCNISCGECSIRLNVFRKKRICFFCKNFFCQACIIHREDEKFCCRKCQILTARPLDRNKLLNLKSRDLVNYLTSRHIPTNGCVEKEDLVNVLMRAVNNSCFHPSSSGHFESGCSSNSYPNSPRNNSCSTGQSYLKQNVSQSVEDLLKEDGIRIVGFNSGENDEGLSQEAHLNQEVTPGEQLNDSEQFSQTLDVEHDTVPGNHEINGDNDVDKEIIPSGSSNIDLGDKGDFNKGIPTNRPLMLSDLKCRSDLDALSVKQLKELLMRNRTDFKGCIERAELIQKANRLWTDYTISRKDLENLTTEELCKICMDAPIECVLLECGHMATCTSCGKQLCECPICRQFVVRCVRTFKA